MASSAFRIQIPPAVNPSYVNPSTSAPTKYVVIDGVRQMNPAYVAYQAAHNEQATTALGGAKALPVVCSMKQHQELREASRSAGQGDVPLARSTDATIDMIQDNAFCQNVGLAPDTALDRLGDVFAKYEVPIGLMNKLMILSEFDQLEFIIDDSGSMTGGSGAKSNSGQLLPTRWAEAQDRMKSIIEILAYVATPEIRIRFLNRDKELNFKRAGETPEAFIGFAHNLINDAFSTKPQGTTPILTRLQQSFARAPGKKIARYLLCDGQPDGGQFSIELISELLRNRPSPDQNPFTMLSCSDQDNEVKWMKELEEVAPYCSELDDFDAEAAEVMEDQGEVFPFTRGFYLISQLVGAMNPDDLDAMDESVPFTKWTLDNLLGVQNTEKDYRRYFDGFLQAQRTRKESTRMDLIKKQQKWEPFFHEFATTHLAKDIRAVSDFEARLAGQQQVPAQPFYGTRV